VPFIFLFLLFIINQFISSVHCWTFSLFFFSFSFFFYFYLYKYLPRERETFLLFGKVYLLFVMRDPYFLVRLKTRQRRDDLHRLRKTISRNPGIRSSPDTWARITEAERAKRSGVKEWEVRKTSSLVVSHTNMEIAW